MRKTGFPTLFFFYAIFNDFLGVREYFFAEIQRDLGLFFGGGANKFSTKLPNKMTKFQNFNKSLKKI